MTILNNGLDIDGKAVVVDLNDGRYEGEQFARAATDTAQQFAVPGHVEQPVAYEAVILAGFGGPEGQDDVIPFLRNVTRGRGIPDERLEEVAHHYRHFGGVSPINQQNRELQAALQAEADRRGLSIPIYWGNRNWDPYLPEALQKAYDDGHRKRSWLAARTNPAALATSARQYREDRESARWASSTLREGRIDKSPFFEPPPASSPPFGRAVMDAPRAHSNSPGGADLTHRTRVIATHSITASEQRNAAGPARCGLGQGLARNDAALPPPTETRAVISGDRALAEKPADSEVPTGPRGESQLVYQEPGRGPRRQPLVELPDNVKRSHARSCGRPGRDLDPHVPVAS